MSPYASQRKRFLTTLADTFSLDELKFLVYITFNVDLYQITTASGSLPATVLALVQWCEREGHTRELIAAARDDRPNRPEFSKLLAEWPAQRVVGPTPGSEFDDQSAWDDWCRQAKAGASSGAVADEHFTPLRPFLRASLDPYRMPAPAKQHVFASKIGPINPFCCHDAFQEKQALGGGFFWEGHSLKATPERGANSVVIVGKRGSGKSALALYRRRYLTDKVNPQDATLAILSSGINEQVIMTSVAKDAMQLATRNVTHLSRSRYLQGTLIAFLVTVLGAELVLDELAGQYSRAESASAAAPTAEDNPYRSFWRQVKDRAERSSSAPVLNWSRQFDPVARALRHRGCQLLIDDVNAPPTPAEFEYLQSLRSSGVGLSLFTHDDSCADRLESAGFARLELSWSPEELQKLACHRLNAADVGNSADSLNPERLRSAFFEEAAWERFWPALHTPRRLFKALTYFIERLPEGQEEIKETDVDAALLTL